MREKEARRRLRNRKKESTPYLWVAGIVLFIASCAGSPDPTPVVEPTTPPAEEPTSPTEEVADDAPEVPQEDEPDPVNSPIQTESLEERVRNLAAQSAELAADNRYLRSEISRLGSNLDQLEAENSVLKSLIDDILLAQGVLRPAAPAERAPQPAARQAVPPAQAEPIARPVPVEEPSPEPQVEPSPEPSPAAVAPAPTPTPSPEPETAQAEPTPPPERTEEAAATGESAAASEPRAAEPPVAVELPAEADTSREPAGGRQGPTPTVTSRLETSRAARDTNLRFDRDESTGTVQYVDSRIAYDAPKTAYLSVQTAPDRRPTVHLHLRVTAETDEEIPRLQSGRVGAGNSGIRLDASNSSTVRTNTQGVTVEEVVAPLTSEVYSAVVDVIRVGGSVAVDGTRGSTEWQLSAVERAAMTNMLYAYQDLGGRLP